MMDEHAPPDTPRKAPHRAPLIPRFGIFGMFLAISVVCVMSAGGFYLMQGLREGGRQAQFIFILFTLAAPMLVAMVASILRYAIKPRSTRKKTKK